MKSKIADLEKKLVEKSLEDVKEELAPQLEIQTGDGQLGHLVLAGRSRSEYEAVVADLNDQLGAARSDLQRDVPPKCVICHLPVMGLFAWCQRCGHGGHDQCMADWHKAEKCCPLGCV